MVEIYTATYCGFCHKAKALLDQKGIEYTEYDVTNDQVGREEMTKRTNGAKTIPQIFINNEYIGGCDDLYRLEYEGHLDNKLKS